MAKLFIILTVLVSTFSALKANPLVGGVWYGHIGNPIVTMAFYPDSTFQMVVYLSEYEQEGLFIEFIDEMLYPFELTIEELIELGYEPPYVREVCIEGSYTAEDDFLLAYAKSYEFGLEGGQSVSPSQFIVNMARELLASLDEETTPFELRTILTALSESGPMLSALLKLALREEPLIASQFSTESDGPGDYLQFMGDFTDETFVRDGMNSSVEATSWGHIKMRR